MIAISYFVVPTVIFLTLVKLNSKRCWLTAKSYNKDTYWTKNNLPIDKVIFWWAVFVFFVFWWVVIPLMLLAFGVYQLIQWITNGKGVVPNDDRRKNDPYR
jgi:hypothetical protein